MCIPRHSVNGSFPDRHRRGNEGISSAESLANIVGVPWYTPFFSNNSNVINFIYILTYDNNHSTEYPAKEGRNALI